MFVKQLSIFIENKSGRLAQIIRTIADAQIDIRALSIADTTSFGILRLIVDKPTEAEKALKTLGLTVKLTDVVAIEVPDYPGGFAGALDFLTAYGVEVEYLYAFISRTEGRACVVLRVTDNDRAVKAFTDNGIRVMQSDELFA